MTSPSTVSNGSPSAALAVSSKSSFHTAVRILPMEQRLAMCQIYAFCRAVDDIADCSAARAQRLADLRRWRSDIAACYAGAAPSALADLAAQIRRFDLAQDDFLAVIDGMTMDVLDDICAPAASTLDLYCDRVASAVGRLAVRIFGLDEVVGPALAHHLGRALQLTNMLRDIDEDAAMGRVYLPAEALGAAGVPLGPAQQMVAHPSLGQACTVLQWQAKAHYGQADALMARCPPRLVRSPRIMSGVYHCLLERLAARGWDAPRPRVKVPRPRLLWIVFQATAGWPGWRPGAAVHSA
jgi:phytoene synthase